MPSSSKVESPGFWTVEWGGVEEKKLEIMAEFDPKDEPLSIFTK